MKTPLAHGSCSKARPHVRTRLEAAAKVREERLFLPLEKKIPVSKFFSLSWEWDRASAKFPSQSHPSQALQGWT